MISINDYMNLKSISGTKIVSLANIQRALLDNYRAISNNIKTQRIEHTKEFTRIYLSVPSETVNIDYIVVLDFYVEPNGNITGNTKFKLFTNSPAMQFTFAYLYNKSDLLIQDFKKYLHPRSLEERPDKRNPSMLLGFEKSIFYAILFIQSKYKAGFPKDNKGTVPKIIPVYSMVKLIAKSKEKGGVIKKNAYFKF